MPLGCLAALVATMPSWLATMIKLDELDINLTEGSKYRPRVRQTRLELLQALDESLGESRQALAGTTDEHLMKPWRFVVAGRVVSEEPRHVMMRDAALNHLAHHRGQLTVYLRLNDVAAPAIYGPSADEGRFE
jgi:uncharacterized damage-inducible protein DinB